MDRNHLDQLISLAYSIEDFIEQDEIRLKGNFTAFTLLMDKLEGFIEADVRLQLTELANYTVSIINGDTMSEYCIFLIKNDRESNVSLPVKNAILDVKKRDCYSSFAELMEGISKVVPNRIATSIIVAMLKHQDAPVNSNHSENVSSLIVDFE